ncbi:hypothetical protein SAMN04489740_4388 [Arthrobacter alpinus]|uniref:DprA winged helix domain-containing protein n=2 Tax=Arthrobacter alpinus TaxID=656366 RepID=A0A1H5PHX0_9MICC|nr:hypothetical protein SAMN04489740_3988 [Arthrobacter alpinus]SEF13469.1 hypothetical protein SAMN04489740_4380 [Arthrobacter alpinus]SEF13527.1 hypothetical protein SAMN04489740_4388 [Arthrobacter alpinus]
MSETQYCLPSDPAMPLFSEACTIVLRTIGRSAKPLSARDIEQATQLKEGSIVEALEVLQSHGVVIMDTETARLNRGALVRAVAKESTGKLLP